MNEDILLHRIIEGDNDAFTQLYNTSVDKLFSYGVSMGFEKNICLDAIQDVFCKIFVNRSTLTNVNNISFYLLRSFKNRLLDISKQSKTEHLNTEHEPTFLTEVSILDAIINEEEMELLQQRVKQLLLNLTNNQREAIYLRYMQEMEYDQIAELLNISPESVRKLVYRAMTKLREQSGMGTGLLLLYLRHYYTSLL
jgi:RNA polymerase sigma factor (sigma-70 family)